MSIFDKTLEEVAKISDLEPKILSDLYKSQKNETFIKGPMKPRERPVTPEGPEKAKKVPDENKWIWDLYEKFTSELQTAILPLEAYLRSFDVYKEVLALKPDEYVLAIELEENQREISDIKAEVASTQKKAEELKKLIPAKI